MKKLTQVTFLTFQFKNNIFAQQVQQQQVQQPQQQQPVQNPNPFTTPVQQQQQNIQQDIEAQIEQMLSGIPSAGNIKALDSLIDENPSLLADPEIAAYYQQKQAQQQAQQPIQNNQNYMQPVQQQMQQPQQQQYQNPQQQQQFQQPVQQQATPVQQYQQNTNTQQVNGQTVTVMDGESAFVNNGTFFGGRQTNQLDYTKVNMQNLPQVVASAYGIDTTKQGWEGELFKQFDNFKSQASNAERFEGEYNEVKNQLEQIPMPLLQAMRASLAGDNWREVIKNIDIDYTKDFDNFSFDERVRLTKRLIPDMNLPDDQIKEDNAILKAGMAAAKTAFNANKNLVEQRQQQELEKRKTTKQTFDASLTASVTALQTQFPEFTQDEVTNLSNMLKEMPKTKVFHDSKGLIKPDAMRRLAFAVHGDLLVEKIKQLGIAQGNNNLASQMITRNQSNGGGGSNNIITQQVQNQAQQAQLQQANEALSMFKTYY